MDTYKDARPCLLSNVLDLHFVGTKEEIEITRISNSDEPLHNTNKDQIQLVGSVGDGFKSELCSDLDVMVINNGSVVMYPYMYQGVTPRNRNKTVLLIREADCRPGYVHLEIGHLGRNVPQSILNAIVPVLNSRFLSSDIFRENHFEKFIDGARPSTVGPSNMIQLYERHMDIVKSFPCICWPSDACEWCCRPRVFGWPNEALVKQIISKGCHLVPVGDKCSDDTFLQWRFSFVIAEQQLVHSLNHIQFKVYGLLKYLLKQIKYRIKRDIGDDILCSYFMKTLILYSVENSPQSLWQEKNIFVSNMLYLATFFYKTGNYKKAIEVCEKNVASVTVYDPEYKAMYCGKGNSTFKRLKHAYSRPVYFDYEKPEICLSELLPELCSLCPLLLIIYPTEYSLFLLFLSYFNLGDIWKSHKILQDMECTRYTEGFIAEPETEKSLPWIIHTLVGICYQTLGDYHSAIQAYRDSLKVPKNGEKNPAMERIKALQSKIVT